MEQIDEVLSRTAAERLRCVQRITDADEETLQIVSAVLERSRPARAERIKRARTGRPDTQKDGGA